MICACVYANAYVFDGGVGSHVLARAELGGQRHHTPHSRVAWAIDSAQHHPVGLLVGEWRF